MAHTSFRKAIALQFMLLTVLFLLIGFGYDYFASRSMTDSIYGFTVSNDIDSIDDLTIKVIGEDVIALEKATLRGGKIYYTIHSVGEGTAFLQIKRADTGAHLFAEEFLVEPGGKLISTVTGNYANCRFHIFMNSLYLTLLAAICLVNLILYHKKLLYSYSLMYIGGLSIWLICTVISQWWAFAGFQGVFPYFDVLQTAGYRFMLYTLPVVLPFCLALTHSNISLMRHEGFRINNALGIIISVLLFFGSVGGILINNIEIVGDGTAQHVIRIAISTYTSLYALMACLLEGAIIGGLMAAKHMPPLDCDYIIILGCMIRKDGSLPPLIRGRVDRALQHDSMQQQKTGKKVIFVPSGGQGRNETMSEAEAMKRYLLSKGIPEERILPEDRSTNTSENMRFSRALIQQRDPNARIAFSTTNYHVFRSGIIASQAHFHPEGMGSKTKWYFWPNAFIREFIGMIVYTKLSIGTIFAGLVLCFAFVELMILR